MHFPVTMIFYILSLAVAGLTAPTELVARNTITKTGDGTFYAPGMGACGKVNKSTDLIVAASHSVFDTFPGHTANPNKNPICGKKMTVKYQGKSVTVTVVDRCPGCAAGDVDLSPAAFKKLANENLGRIKVSWTLQE